MGRLEIGEFKLKIHNDTPYTYIIYFGGVVHTVHGSDKRVDDMPSSILQDDKLLFV